MAVSIKLCFLLMAAVVFHYSWAQTANYCDTALCFGHTGHVGCNNSGTFDATCSANARIVPMTEELRSLLVRKHNELRNKAAAGIGNLPPAARMASMQWDQELADLAELRSRRCHSRHDVCRSTPSFHYAGQNIVATPFVDPNLDNINVLDVVNTQLEHWFSQYQQTTAAQIQQYKDSTPIIGAFTGMVQEKANRVGCALMQHTVDNGKAQMVTTCNYAFINVEGLPVYTAGPTASQCKTGRNVAWANLCKVAEVYAVNELANLDSSSRIIIK